MMGRISHRKGLSPRVRGNQLFNRPIRAMRGSIPACAGEPRRCALAGLRKWVYPRVCGGTEGGAASGGRVGGLSPRVRGNPLPPIRRR